MGSRIRPLVCICYIFRHKNSCRRRGGRGTDRGSVGVAVSDPILD